MKFAIISDIHGNLTAFEAVLAAIKTQNVNQFICLGDVAAFGPQPRECLQKLRELDCPIVMGNTDDFLLNPIIPEKWRDSQISHIEKWCAEQLTAAELDFVRSFQKTIVIDDLILAYHGSPHSYNDHILPTTPDETLAHYFEGYQTHIMMGGHTHQQMIRRYKQASVINPGSVGLVFENPFDGGDSYYLPVAEHAILTLSDNERHICLHRIPFDLDTHLSAVAATDMPHQAWYAAQWKDR